MARRDDSDGFDAGGESRYGEELLRAGWNPALHLLQSWSDRTRSIAGEEAPAARSDEKAATFMRRIHRAGA